MADEVKIIRLVIDSSKAVDGSNEATRALEKIDKATETMSSTMAKMEKSVAQAATVLKANLIALLYEAGARLVNMAKDALNAAAGLDELASQLGITAQGLQALQFSAVQNGVKLEQLETGVSKFSQKMGEAAGGSKDMITALNNIGVKILDVNGHLRPTERLMQEVATAILALDGPAKQSAAAVDFFGKAGARMLPMLPELAKGLNDMGEAARRAGAMISAEAIAKLDKLADAGERNKLVFRAMFAENAAGPLTDVLDFISRKMTNLSNLIRDASSSMSAFLAMASNPVAYMGRMFASTPGEKLSSDIASTEKSIAEREKALAGFGPGDWRNQQYTEAALVKERATLAALQRQQNVANVGGKSFGSASGDPDNIGVYIPTKLGGSKNPTASGGGESPEEKYAKLTLKLQETARAQDIMTEAARNGDVAFEEAKVHLDAVQKTLEIFGKRLADNDPLLVELEARLLRISRGGAAQAFNVATTELEKQNVVLDAQIRLMNESPDIIAKEIALIKVRQDVEKAGGKLSEDEVNRRYTAIEQNEKLKVQAEQLKKAQELWTEPLKQALGDIQRLGADAFEKMLESGNFSFQSLAQSFTQILRRMAAEFLALATIRPVMSVLVNAVSPSMARQMGLDTSAGGVGVGSGGGGLFGGGGFGDLFSGIGNTLSSAWDKTATFFGGGPALSPAGMAMPAGAGPMGLGGIGGSGISWGQGLGAAAGFGMGAYQLATSKSTAQTIGGIASMVGAGVSLIPGIGQIAGPIIGILGSVLPGLLGGGTPEPPTMQATSALNFANGSFNSSGGAYGGAKDIQWGSTASSLLSMIRGAGVTANSSGYGLMQQTYAKGDFSNATTFVNGQQWSQSSDPQQQAQGLNTASAHVAHQIMLEVGSGISDVMRQGLAKFGLDNLQHAFSMEELNATVAELNNFDAAIKNIGKTTTTVEKSLADIDASFASLLDTAAKYGLDPTAIQGESNKAKQGVFDDFAKSIRMGTLDITDPQASALLRLDDEKKGVLENNDAIIKAFGDTASQLVQIEELYGLKRQKIVEQYADASTKAMTQSLSSIDDVIKRLTIGDLSNATPGAVYSAAKGTYNADYAKARAGDTAAMSRISGEATDFATASRAYNGSSTGFTSDRNQIVGDLATLSLNNGGDVSSLTTALGILNLRLADLTAKFEASANDNEALRIEIAELTSQIARLTANK